MTISRTTSGEINTRIISENKKLAPNKPGLERLLPENISNEDTVSISEQAKALLADMEALEHMWESGKEAAEGAGEGFANKLKCLKIAMHIMDGDRVPLKDMQFLAENEPQMYSNALLLQRTKENPKIHKSLLKEDKIELEEGVTSGLDAIISDISEGSEEILVEIENEE